MTITIDEDDPPPTVFLTVSPSTPNISETGGVATITANLTSTVASATTVTLAINVSSTATDPADYTRTASLDLVIPANTLTSSTTFDITAVGDLLDENDETVVVDIASVTGGIAEGSPNTITVTILDDDDPPSVAWTGTDSTVAENVGTVTATAQLSAPSGKTITVQVAVSGTAANPADYTRTPAAASPFTLTFTPGDTSEDVVVTIIDDPTAGEVPNETVILTLQTPTNVTLGSQTIRTISIQDNDPDAIADSYNATGNFELTVPAGDGPPCTPQIEGLLCNDFTVPTATTVTTFGPNAGTQVAPGTASTTAQGGNLTVQANGSFVYNPPAGFTGNDTFVYFLGTDSATVTINVTGDANGDLLWFVDENATVAGNGRRTTPFSTLDAFHDANLGGANQPKDGDFVFLYESTDPYLGPVQLRAGQKLIGQDASASIASIYGVTLPAGQRRVPRRRRRRHRHDHRQRRHRDHARHWQHPARLHPRRRRGRRHRHRRHQLRHPDLRAERQRGRHHQHQRPGLEPGDRHRQRRARGDLILGRRQ